MITLKACLPTKIKKKKKWISFLGCFQQSFFLQTNLPPSSNHTIVKSINPKPQILNLYYELIYPLIQKESTTLKKNKSKKNGI